MHGMNSVKNSYTRVCEIFKRVSVKQISPSAIFLSSWRGQWKVLVFRRALYNHSGWNYFGVSHGDTSTVMDSNRHVAFTILLSLLSEGHTKW